MVGGGYMPNAPPPHTYYILPLPPSSGRSMQRILKLSLLALKNVSSNRISTWKWKQTDYTNEFIIGIVNMYMQ